MTSKEGAVVVVPCAPSMSWDDSLFLSEVMSMKKILKKSLIWSLLLLFLSCNRGSSNLDLTPDDCSTGSGLTAVKQQYLNQKEYYLARFEYEKVAENKAEETRSCPAHVIKAATGEEDEEIGIGFYLIATLSYFCVRDMIESALSRYEGQQKPEDQNIVFGTFLFTSEEDGSTKRNIKIGTKIGNPKDKTSLATADFGDITLNSEIFSNEKIKEQLNSYQNVQDSLSRQEFYFNNMAILGIDFYAKEDPFTKFQSQPIKSKDNFNEVAPYVLSQLEKHFTKSPAPTTDASPPIGKPIDIAICEILPKTEGPPKSCGGINNKYQVTFSQPTAVGQSDKIKAVVRDKNSGTMDGTLDLTKVEGGSFLIADGKVLGIIPENPNAPSTTLVARGDTPSIPVETTSTEEAYQEFLAKHGLGGTGGVGGLVINDDDPKWLQALKALSPLTRMLFTRQRDNDNVRRVQVDVEETQKQIDTIQQSSGDDDSGDNTQLQQLLTKLDKQTLALERMQREIDAQKISIAGLTRGNSDGKNGGNQNNQKPCPDNE